MKITYNNIKLRDKKQKTLILGGLHMTRITVSMFKQKIELASEILNEKLENRSYNGYEHLTLRG